MQFLLITSGIGTAVIFGWLISTTMPGDSESPHVTPQIEHGTLLSGANIAELERGRSYYVQLCQDCHGKLGDGQGVWSYRMMPRPSDLTGSVVQGRSDNELLVVIQQGIPGTAMRGWSDSLNEAQQQQVVSFVRYLAQVRGS